MNWNYFIPFLQKIEGLSTISLFKRIIYNLRGFPHKKVYFPQKEKLILRINNIL
jgi:hypothetical protein